METEVQQFYRGKTLFLTGATGFLGKVFMEKILRTTEVKRIYILIRPKKGQDVKERVENIFKDPLFAQLNKLKPNAKEKISTISGDCLLPNLGISQNDENVLYENTNIVIHSAATVRFNEPLATAITVNVGATLDMLKLAQQMPKLECFTYVSSIFSCCLEKHIAERPYAHKLKMNAMQAVQLNDILGADILNLIAKNLIQDFPNTYTYSKLLAEEAILSHGKGLPICIFRPGIIIPTYKEPVAGWTDNLYGPIGILYGAAAGLLHIMYCYKNMDAPIVPVDFSVNLMITSTYETAKLADVNMPDVQWPKIYNLIPTADNCITWQQGVRYVAEHGAELPLTRMIWWPFFMSIDSKLKYNVLCFIYHTIPSYLFDFAALILNKKRRMIRTYATIHKQIEVLNFFVENTWTYSAENSNKLANSLSIDDRELYPFNMATLNWSQYIKEGLYGMRQYLAKESVDTIPQAKRSLRRLFYLHRLVQCVIYGGGSMLFFFTLMKFLKK